MARVNGFVGQLEAETGIIAEDAGAGVIPPDFVIDKAIGQLTRFAEGGASQNLLVQSLVRRLPEAQAIPEPGQRFAFHGYRFHVLRRNRNQITALRIDREQVANEDGA